MVQRKLIDSVEYLCDKFNLQARFHIQNAKGSPMLVTDIKSNTLGMRDVSLVGIELIALKETEENGKKTVSSDSGEE